MTQLTYLQKRALYESIMNTIAKKVKQMLNESYNNITLNENVDAATEKRNEKFVESLCKRYKLTYWEGDSVCGDVSKESVLRKVRSIIAERMPVGQIKFAHPDNVYYFTFKSWKSKSL